MRIGDADLHDLGAGTIARIGQVQGNRHVAVPGRARLDLEAAALERRVGEAVTEREQRRDAFVLEAPIADEHAFLGQLAEYGLDAALDLAVVGGSGGGRHERKDYRYA